ncbi:MAG: type VI secretion system membrane subunit TssM [Nitrospira sp.]|nr:type VI secretion system membrane subunit TssM [Nitrospira sp.]
MKKLWAYVKALGVGVVNHPQQVMDVAVLCLVVLVWIWGPRFDWLAAADMRVGVMIGLAALWWVVTPVIRHLYAKRCATRLEASLRVEGRPGQSDQADLKEKKDALRVQFRKGIDALKQSQLAKGVSGSTALYELPLVMIIGPSACGKTTALRESGLTFPLLNGEGKGLSAVGAGGTRNCDWWFTNEGILLDTAGRYMNQTEADKEEWEEFLKLLRKYRTRKPINGAIVAVPISDLINASDESIERQATNIRARIDQLIKRLGVVFPVYVMVTKCDLPKGFEEFFHDMEENERKQVWGCTFPKSGGGSGSVGSRVRSGLNELYSVANERRLVRLSATRGSGQVPILSFPMELVVAHDRLVQFVGTLFQENVYQKDYPFFRGVYFTSGTQKGTPISQVLKQVIQQSGLSDEMIPGSSQTVEKSYFLKDLFLRVIFPDQDLVMPSSAWNARLRRMRVAMVGIMVVAVPVAVAGLMASFTANERALLATKAAASKLQQPAQDSVQFPTQVKLLGALSSQLSEIDMFTQKGIPLWISLFYRGDQLRQKLRDVYFEGFGRVFLDETMQSMEQQFVRVRKLPDHALLEKGAFKEQYDLLKIYLMLVEPRYFKKEVVKTWLNTHWSNKLDAEGNADLKPEVGKEIEFYTEYIASERPMHQDTRIDGLVSAVQEQLRRIPLGQRLYALSRGDAEPSLTAFTVDPILSGHVSSKNEKSDHEESVSGICTLDGWKGPFQQSVRTVLTETEDEGWVLGEVKVDRRSLETEIKRLHGRDCVQQWHAFLRSLHVRLQTAVTPKEVEQELKVLAATDSPIQRILDAVVRNTVEDPDPLSIGPADGGKSVSRSPSDARSPDEFPTAMSNLFKGLPQLIAAPKDGKGNAPFTTYLAAMGKVHQAVDAAWSGPEYTITLATRLVNGDPNEILDAMKQTEEMLLNPNLGPWTNAIDQFMKEPWIRTAEAIMTQATDVVQDRWKENVYRVCQDKVRGRYPFDAGGKEEASIQDVSDMFRPKTGHLWRFYDEELQKFMVERRGGWEVKKWKGIGITLSNEFLTSLNEARVLRDSLYRLDSQDPNVPSVKFDVQPDEDEYRRLNGSKTNDLSEIHLEVGGQAFRYRNDKPKWVPMEWPGPRLAGGAALWLVINGIPEHPTELQFPGEWGLIHLIDADRSKSKKDPNSYDVKWDVHLRDGRSVQVPYKFKPKTPFHPAIFKQVRCIEHLSDKP